MISPACAVRSLRGFRLINRRPLLSVMLLPSVPMNEDRLTTSGSFRMAAASACWRSAMAVKEMDCGASDVAAISPVSWTGKKPLGTMT